MRARLNTYPAYGVGCAAVWAVILLVTQRRGDAEKRKTMQLFCVAWWSGWTSATIAPRDDRTLQIASVVLVAVGVGSVIRFLWGARNRP
jgi:drug/metabolite transporter (DMT)-like permease